MESALPTHPGLFPSALIVSHYNMFRYPVLTCFLQGELNEPGSSGEVKHGNYSTIRFLLFSTKEEK